MTEPTLYTSSRLEERYYDFYHPAGLRILVAPKALSTCYATLGIGHRYLRPFRQTLCR